MRLLRALLVTLLLGSSLLQAATLPEGFVYLHSVIPNIRLELRYLGDNNFVGRPIDGYRAAKGILTAPAAQALAEVQRELAPFGLGLKVFDAYRPQRAVNDFLRWADDLQDTRNKASYYPEVEKSELFPQGYLAALSGHSRGSTLDLTIVSLKTGEEIDMGGSYDYFGPRSWPTSELPDASERAHRLLLQSLMEQHGFVRYPQEWWHFTLKNEPYPDIYFDFPVE